MCLDAVVPEPCHCRTKTTRRLLGLPSSPTLPARTGTGHQSELLPKCIWCHWQVQLASSCLLVLRWHGLHQVGYMAKANKVFKDQIHFHVLSLVSHCSCLLLTPGHSFINLRCISTARASAKFRWSWSSYGPLALAKGLMPHLRPDASFPS